jgi:hypothetical protein
MNRTIMERARSMRLHVDFPLQLWADAIDIVVYLINRGPSSSLDGIIPEEAWTGKKENYSFLKTFGCEAFVHIDKENRTKVTQCLMRSLKKKFQRYQKIKMYNNRRNRYLKLLQVLLEDLPG